MRNHVTFEKFMKVSSNASTVRGLPNADRNFMIGMTVSSIMSFAIALLAGELIYT